MEDVARSRMLWLGLSLIEWCKAATGADKWRRKY